MTDQTTTVTVPFTIRKRGGRKLILTPDGTLASPPTRSRPDGALLKALARAFRWKKMLEEGDYQTLEEIANAENINPSYVSRLLRMTLLAPSIVERAGTLFHRGNVRGARYNAATQTEVDTEEF